MQRPHRAPIVALLIVVGLTASACGGNDSSTSDDSVPSASGAAGTSPAATAAPDTAGPDTSPAATAAPATAGPDNAPDTAPDTTGPETAPDTEPDTTAPTPVTGWTATDFVPGAFEVGYSGNWEGGDGPSPAAPAEGEPPADGYYVATVREPWDPERPDRLAVRIRRLELCSVLPDGCQYMDDGAMNVDPSWQLDLDLPLGPTTDVVVAGFSCWDVPETKRATGVELAELFAAYTADYASAIAPQLTGNIADYGLALAVAAAPTGGFVGEEAACPGGLAGPLRYVHDDAPVLLLQTVTDGEGGPLDATDLVRLAGVRYTDGNPLFAFYAGFTS